MDSDFATYFKRTTHVVQRCKDEEQRCSRGRETGRAARRYAASVYELLVVDVDAEGHAAGSSVQPLPGYDVEASALDPANPDGVLWLGVEQPSNSVLEYSLVTGNVFRETETSGTSTLEALAWVEEASGEHTLWYVRPARKYFSDESRRRRGRDVAIPWRRLAADARGRDVAIPWRRVAADARG